MTLRLAAILTAAAMVSACAPRAEPVEPVADLGQPVYAKDGVTVVGYSNDLDGDGMADQ